MRTNYLIRTGALLAGIVLSQASVLAQSWQTVDDFQFVLGGSSGDISVDPSGSVLYSVGSAGIDTRGDRAAGVVRASLDKGATWEVVHTLAPDEWSDPHFRAVAVGTNPDATLRVFVAGHLYDYTTGDQMWIVQEGAQNTGEWITSDAVNPANGWSSCGDIKVNAAGDVYAAGVLRDTVLNTGYWLVRKRAAGATDFQNVDNFDGGTAQARSIAFHPTAGIFVAGIAGNVWTVRKSSNNGATWSTVDSFKDTGGIASAAESIVVSSVNGAIYVAGRAQQAVKKPNRLVWNWVVRRSTNGGATWTVIDRYGALPSGISATAITMSGGSIFVGGYTPSSWLVRRGVLGANGSVSWNVSDDYQMSPGEPAILNGITADGEGNVYGTGRATDGATLPSGERIFRWLTRKLSLAQ